MSVCDAASQTPHRRPHARSPQRVARAQTQSHSRQYFAHSTLDTHDLRRGLRVHRPNRALACISRTRHSRSPQQVARAQTQSHSRLHFAHSTRTISAEGCARTDPIALSPAFRALDTHDLRMLRAHRLNRTLACISRTRHARSPQRVARAAGKSHSRLHFEFRALDTHDLRRGLRGQPANRTLAISRLRFAHSTRAIPGGHLITKNESVGQMTIWPPKNHLDT